MLNALRRGSKTFVAKILIGLLVVGFALFGVSEFVNQVDRTEVARAGDTPVGVTEFIRTYERARRNTSDQIGRNLTSEEAAALGVPTQVLQALLTDAFQVDAAHALGLDLGDEALAERIRTDPLFQTSGGGFDRARFEFMLSENRYDEAEYVELERDAAAREMLVNGLVGGLTAPQPYLEAFNTFQNQQRRIDYIEITDAALGEAPAPTDAELRTFFEENKDEFRAPEYRTFSFITLTADAVADPAAVPQDEVREAYDEEGAYGAAERRRVQQVVLSDTAVAEDAARRLSEGTAFETILSELERTLADVDLGLVTREELVDPAVAEAAFSLGSGEAAAVDGRFGPILVRVGEIEEAGKAPFADVEGEIRAELARRDAVRQLRPLTDNLEDEFAGGGSIGEAAARFDLPSRTVTVDEAGRDQSGEPVDFGEAAGATVTAFSMEPGDDPRRVRGIDQRVWVQVDSVIASAERDYDAVTDEVREAFLADREANRLAARAEEALAAIDGGADVADVAADLGLSAQTSELYSRGAPAAGLPQGVLEASFEGGLGHTGSVIAGAGQHIVFEVAELVDPVFFEGAADLRPIADTLREGLANALLFGVVNGWQSEVGSTLNEPVFLGVTGQSDDPRFRY